MQWLQKGPDFGTRSRLGPMSKYGPEKGPICLSSPEVHKCDFELCTDASKLNIQTEIYVYLLLSDIVFW